MSCEDGDIVVYKVIFEKSIIAQVVHIIKGDKLNVRHNLIKTNVRFQ